MGYGLRGVLAAAGVLLIGGSVGLVEPSLSSAASDAKQSRLDSAALVQVGELRTALADWQVHFEPIVAQAGVMDAATLTQSALLAQTVLDDAAAANDALTTLDLTALSGEVATVAAAFTQTLTKLRSVTAETPVPEAVALVVAERAEYAQFWEVTATAITQLREILDANAEGVVSHLAAAHARIRAILALSVGVAGVGVVVIGARARRQLRAERVAAHRHRFDTSLQTGLGMAASESEVYRAVNWALRESVPGLQVELLVAGSGRPHFYQAIHTGAGGAEERSGCGVASPAECPAASHGAALVFPTSTATDACPYLHDRPSGPCSAACVPMGAAGMTIGVLHATAVDGTPPEHTKIDLLNITAHRTAERISLLRAFEKSETEASTDPLTGLLNRRSLENQVRDLQRDGTAYVVAYGDLDHFKALNDRDGHEAGDQALRLFSKVVRDSIRPNDIAARYGGEEFVILMFGSDTNAATAVLERVRENLTLALTAGRLPPFTVSFGVASSTETDTFDQIVSQADRALLAAKAAGRNRVIVATNPTDPVPASLTTT